MIPSSSLASVYVKIIGENSLLGMAQSNLFYNLDRISKVRTHTFLANNGQDKNGISQNYGAERHYSWNDTVIDCRDTPNLVESDLLIDFCDTVAENKRFLSFKNEMEERLDSAIIAEPFYSIVKGDNNMRFDIRNKSSSNFDMIRVGLKLTAPDDEHFDHGLDHMKKNLCPLNAVRRSMAKA